MKYDVVQAYDDEGEYESSLAYKYDPQKKQHYFIGCTNSQEDAVGLLVEDFNKHSPNFKLCRDESASGLQFVILDCRGLFYPSLVLHESTGKVMLGSFWDQLDFITAYQYYAVPRGSAKREGVYVA